MAALLVSAGAGNATRLALFPGLRQGARAIRIAGIASPLHDGLLLRPQLADAVRAEIVPTGQGRR